jgi:hypothetical protein
MIEWLQFPIESTDPNEPYIPQVLTATFAKWYTEMNVKQ